MRQTKTGILLANLGTPDDPTNSNRRWPRGCQIRPSRWG